MLGRAVAGPLAIGLVLPPGVIRGASRRHHRVGRRRRICHQIRATKEGRSHATASADTDCDQSGTRRPRRRFRGWLRTIALPASRKHRPGQEGRWEILRTTEQEDGTVVFAFIFRGGDPAEWNLEELLDQALGAKDAQRAMAGLHEMLKREQTSWFLTPVRL
jgi:hypothetical protein